MNFKKCIFILFVSYTSFFSAACCANEGQTLILAEADARKMFFECMKLQRTGSKAPSDYFMCRRSCEDYTKMFSHDFTEFGLRANKSEECRGAYLNVSGTDVAPTVPRDYVRPKASARN